MVPASTVKTRFVRGLIPVHRPSGIDRRACLLGLALAVVALLGGSLSAFEVRPQGDFYDDPLPTGAVARLGTIRFRHGGDVVYQIRFAPGDELLASAGKDNVVRVWDPRTGQQLHRLEEHGGEVRDLAFFPAADRLASVSWLPSGNNDQSLCIWDLATGELIHRIGLAGHGSLCVAVSFDGNTVVTATDDGDVDLWDASSGEKVRNISMASVSPRSLVFLDEGRTLASGSIYERTTQPGFALTVFDLDGERPKQTFEFQLNTRNRTSDIDPRTGAGCILCPSADRSTIGVATNDGVVRFFDVASKSFTHEISGLPNKTTALSPSGQFVASGHQGITLRDRTKVVQADDFWSGDASVTALDFSSDGQQLVAATDTGIIRLWDIESSKDLIEPGPTHDRWVKAIAFSPDGSRVVTGGMDDKLRCWQVATGEQLWAINARTNVLASTVLEFTPDGDEVLLGMRHNREVEFYDADTGKKSRSITTAAHGDVLALSQDQQLLVLARANNGVELVDLETGVKKQAGEGSRVRMDAVAIAPDGATVATASRSGGRNEEPVVRLWDIDQQAEPIRSLMAPGDDNNKVFGADYVCFSPDGQYVAAASQQAILVWDTASGRLLWEFPSSGARLWPIAFSPDSRLLASSDNSEIVLYELATGEEAARLTGHETYLTCIVFHPDGKRLATGAWDGTTLVWDLSTLADELYSQSPSLDDRLSKLWQALDDLDSHRGQSAVWALVRHGDEAVKLLADQLEPERLPVIDQGELSTMLLELEDDDYATRERAMDKLAALGAAVTPHFEAVLQATPSLELRSRIIRLMREQEESLYEIDPAELLILRSIQVLEQIATEPARQLLEHLATGDAEQLATKASQRALSRVERRIRNRVVNP